MGADKKIAEELRTKETEDEQYLWQYLGNKKILNVRFKRQHLILNFLADFYCHQANLIIEVDGGYHHLPQQYEYDKSRD